MIIDNSEGGGAEPDGELTPRYDASDMKHWLLPGKGDIPRAARRRAKGTTAPSHALPGGIASKIADGHRNSTLTSLGGLLRRHGLTETVIADALQKINENQCDPPLPTDEVDRIACSLMKYIPADPKFITQSVNDVGNAYRLVELFGTVICYAPRWKKWLVWNDRYWQVDCHGLIAELAKKTARYIYIEAAAQMDDALRKMLSMHANRSMQQRQLQAMVQVASSDPKLVVNESRFDSNDMLFGVQNGVINLKTGELISHRPDQYITRLSPVFFDALATAPTFERFLDEITQGDAELKQFVLTLFGYCLTGCISEQKLFFFFGSGANGKTTLLSIFRDVMGDELSKQTPSDTLMSKPYGKTSTNDLARLVGVRLVATSEVEDGSHLAESLIKNLTGGDVIIARLLYSEFFEYLPKFKLIVAGNHKPVIRGDDDGIWRRFVLVPFNATIPEEKRDPNLLEKLRAELPGIFNLAVAGCLRWQKFGLRPPRAVTQASADYRQEMDILGEWITTCGVEESNAAWRAGAAYLSYQQWAVANGFRSMTSASFGRKMRERYGAKRDSKGWTYLGIQARVGV